LRALKIKSTFLPRSAFPRSAGAISLLVVASALCACNSSKMIGDLNPSETLTQGYVIDQQAIDLVPVGSSREQVLLALGTPSTKATFDNEAFYYISQTRKRYVAFDKPRLVDQKVLAVYFGEDGRVTQIANYGLKDGKVFDFISRTTPTGGKDQNFLSQIMGGASKLAPGLPGGGGGASPGT
jgi:outer membrane protein assembly factor BamE (lipoprotein component of BamABCDE complex)